MISLLTINDNERTNKNKRSLAIFAQLSPFKINVQD